jgi:methylglutaconyl-CoA hydratase
VSEARWVRLERLESGVRSMILDRPPVNALGRELVEDLQTAIDALALDDEARCVIVRSAGKHFCAGADLKERKTMTLDDVRAFVPRLAGVCNGLAALPMPTIAAVNGAAAGGGCELLLACDLRVVAADSSIGLRETALAIIPGAGGTQRLPRLIGPARAKRWIFAAALHDAEQALADGVADRVVPVEDLHDAALEMAGAIAQNGPLAVRLAKRAIDRGLELPLDRGLAGEWELYQKVLGTRDRDEGVAAFAEKRAPRYEGR